jgi:hypothetical protein
MCALPGSDMRRVQSDNLALKVVVGVDTFAGGHAALSPIQ